MLQANWAWRCRAAVWAPAVAAGLAVAGVPGWRVVLVAATGVSVVAVERWLRNPQSPSERPDLGADDPRLAMSFVAVQSPAGRVSTEDWSERCTTLNEAADEALQRIKQISLVAEQTVTSGMLGSQLIQGNADDAHEVGARARDIATSSQRAAAASAGVVAAAEASSSRLEAAVTLVLTLRESLVNSADEVSRLSDVSSKIGGIVLVLQKLSSQIGLVALNAAIEAARAGEHGRSFAVVADAIRKLAGESSSSAQEITRLAETIRAGTKGAADRMTASTAEVGQAAEQLAQAQEMIAGIFAEVKTGDRNLEEISSGIVGHAAAVDRMVSGIQIIAELTDQVTQESMQVTESCQFAGEAAQRLSDLVRAIAIDLGGLPPHLPDLLTESYPASEVGDGLARS